MQELDKLKRELEQKYNQELSVHKEGKPTARNSRRFCMRRRNKLRPSQRGMAKQKLSSSSSETGTRSLRESSPALRRTAKKSSEPSRRSSRHPKIAWAS
jgi:hypothetical protein